MQEGPDVVIPGEGPEQLHHFRHVLLSARPSEGGKTDGCTQQPHLPPCPRAPQLLSSGTSFGLPGRINGLVLELRSVLG